MIETDGFDDLERALQELEGGLGGAAAMVSGFDAELKRIHQTFSDTGRGVSKLEGTLSRGLARAFDGVVFDGMRASEALERVARGVIDSAYRAAVRPVTDQLGGALTAGMTQLFGAFSPFAQGGAFAQGRVVPFASGGVVSAPVRFPMRGGTGLMGEAGPEAILPLSRGADGRLGVRASAGRAPVSVVMNIQTPDLQGFQRSRSQIAAQMSRALSQGARNR
ncbi:phage tail tape measure protein [Salipiger mangrovisoli]|uniref:Phage tail tape measure protein n=1 Tax=Salipiger mangrovisoli TaxID=2865933 RepID=A0ABR9WWQ0_9RHOB|nr:phage tail tape measure protein [Salipiger mangrovisoli]MBE9635712.1 phage tail tape measure protein [Salipiger mangrovisoli]